MGLFLAIDGGGTKTRCVIGDETRVLGRAAAGTVKLLRVGEQEATARVEAMLAEAAATAGVSLGAVTRTCFGLAGCGLPAVREWAERAVSKLVVGEVMVCGDEEIALDAAFAGGPGILVVAGTGSNAIGRAESGEMFGAGGWGPVLGDEGSGYWIGLEAVRAALRGKDRAGGSTRLLEEILREWGLGSVAELVGLGNRRSGEGTADFAELAPVVARCAEAGDALAAGVLERAGEELAELVEVVWEKMRAVVGEVPDEVGVAFTGSVLAKIKRVREAMATRLAGSVAVARMGEAAVDPLEGALWRARALRAVLDASRAEGGRGGFLRE